MPVSSRPRATRALGQVLLTSLVLLAGAPVASPQGWSVFKSDRFGFAMLVAPGTRWEARDLGNGWGGMHARKGTLEFVGIVSLGTFADPAAMERSAVRFTKIPADAWTLNDQGQNMNGWRWWRTYRARIEPTGRTVFAVLGTGPRGSYMLLLETSHADFAANKALYDQWYRSLTLY
jgi:hypothetical protein